MAVTGHALNQLLQQMDRTFSNVTGQSVSFIDQEGHYQGPLRLDVFTGFCRRVISSEKALSTVWPATTASGWTPSSGVRCPSVTWASA